MTITEDTNIISISDSAASRLHTLNTDGKCALRLQVLAGGCNGFQYKFTIIPSADIAANDEIIIKNKQNFVIDKLSAKLIAGATIDFIEDLAGAEFIVKNNPNANSKCGCGNSFSAKILS